MKEFNFIDRSETLKVEGVEYKIDVSNYDFMKACQEKITPLEEAHKKFNKDKDITGLIEVIKPIINLILNDDFERLWEIAGHNVFSMIDLTSVITEMIQKGFIYKRSEYVQPAN